MYKSTSGLFIGVLVEGPRELNPEMASLLVVDPTEMTSA